MNMLNMAGLHTALTQSNRPLRLRLWSPNRPLDEILLVRHVDGRETLCGGIEYRLLCLSTHATLPLKEFMALPTALQFVTDRGHHQDLPRT